MGTGMDKATAMLVKNELDGLHDQIRQWKAKYDALKASHTNLKDTLQLFVSLLEHQGSFIQKRDIERAKQDLKEAEKI